MKSYIDTFENIPMIYRFWDDKNNIIYIGSTTNLLYRFISHSHLPQECYKSIRYIDYATVESREIAKKYELYYIKKYLPKYNSVGKSPLKEGYEELDDLFFLPFKEKILRYVECPSPNIDVSKLCDCYIEFKDRNSGKILQLKYSEFMEMQANNDIEEQAKVVDKFFSDPDCYELSDKYDYYCP